MVMRIKEVREKSGIMQRDLAKRLGVRQSAISNWECEFSLPRSRQLPALAQALGCSIDDLFANTESEEAYGT